MNISLPGPLKEWVDSQVKSGDYSSASEYIRDLIRREQKRVARSESNAASEGSGSVGSTARAGKTMDR
ncbi:MAG TPA: type II toxin-antitoxin system ParD family antitoxin [Blastocatellia bacterium]|nr:type II toxin-antitoxin system ParD family antitoxin [Blastocatellia bacterium]